MSGATATTAQPPVKTSAARIMVFLSPILAINRLIEAAAVIDPARYSANVQLIRFRPPISSTALGIVVAVNIEFDACNHNANAIVANFGKYSRLSKTCQVAP